MGFYPDGHERDFQCRFSPTHFEGEGKQVIRKVLAGAADLQVRVTGHLIN